MRRIGAPAVIFFAFLFAILVSAESASATMYAVDDSTDSLYTIDLATGAATLVGPAGQNLSYTGLAYDTANSTMYVSDVAIPGGGYGLGSVDLATGAVTIIGSHIISVDVMGLAFAGGTMYGADIDNDSLDTIDLATGAATIVGPFVNQDSIGMRCLAYDAGTDTLYGMGQTNLYTINRTTGLATLVGPHGVAVGGYIGCEVDSSSGILYMGDNVIGNLYGINKTTGAATLVGATGIAISGLADVPAAVAAPVPTLNEWGLVLFMVLAGIGSAFYLRRRRAAN